MSVACDIRVITFFISIGCKVLRSNYKNILYVVETYECYCAR